MKCQLKGIDDLKKQNSWINNLLQFRVRFLRTTKRKAIFVKNRVNRSLGKHRIEAPPLPTQVPICPGDMVRVRSKEEIRSMLDDHEKYKGCFFIDEMYEHCGKAFKVLKQVDWFFDEAKQKLCRCKDNVLLEGVVCSGRQRLYSESCDRNCFFFWHHDWLDKIQ